MALDPSVQAWFDDLKKNGNIAAEDISAIEAVADKNPSIAQQMKDSFLRQSDYSRRQDELRQKQAAVEAEDQRVKTFESQLQQWKTGADSKLTEALKARAEAEASLNVFAAANGIDLKKETQVVNPPGFDPSKYLTTDQANEVVRRGVQESALVDASISDLQEQHKVLFGTPIPNVVGMVQEAMAKGKSLSAYWEEKHGVPAKRAEIQSANIQAQIAEGVKAGVAKELSERALQPQNVFTRNSTHSIFSNPNITKPVDNERMQGSGVAAAVAAFQEGKYRK